MKQPFILSRDDRIGFADPKGGWDCCEKGFADALLFVFITYSLKFQLAQRDKYKKASTIVLTLFVTVGMTGFEPAASRPPDERATGLRYIPILFVQMVILSFGQVIYFSSV